MIKTHRFLEIFFLILIPIYKSSMPKRNYVQAKKEIEDLMLEDVDCVAEFGISKWSDVWDSSFETKNILEEGKVIDFTYSEKALSIQKALNKGVEKAIDVAKSIDTPEFFDYLLGEVKIEGNFKGGFAKCRIKTT